MLALFRTHGATIDEAAETFAHLIRTGLTGRPGEMTVLANRLSTEGVTVSLRPSAP